MVNQEDESREHGNPGGQDAEHTDARSRREVAAVWRVAQNHSIDVTPPRSPRRDRDTRRGSACRHREAKCAARSGSGSHWPEIRIPSRGRITRGGRSALRERNRLAASKPVATRGRRWCARAIWRRIVASRPTPGNTSMSLSTGTEAQKNSRLTRTAPRRCTGVVVANTRGRAIPSGPTRCTDHVRHRRIGHPRGRTTVLHLGVRGSAPTRGGEVLALGRIAARRWPRVGPDPATHGVATVSTGSQRSARGAEEQGRIGPVLCPEASDVPAHSDVGWGGQ